HRLPRVGAHARDRLRGSRARPAADARRQRRSRCNDSRPEFLSLERESSQRDAPRLSGRRARFSLPVSRLVHAAGGGVSHVRLAVRAVLNRSRFRKGDRMSVSAVETATAVRPFTVNVPEESLADLRRRIAATRWPSKELVADASQGVQLATLQALMRYWATE